MELRTNTQRRGSQRLLGAAMVALAAAAGLMLAIAAEGSQHRAKAIVSETGAFATNSQTGQAILTATGMTPGDSVSGEVRIANAGDLPGTFSLGQRLQSETAGTGGGHLYSRLWLTIREAGAATTLYDGPLPGM